MDLQCVICPSLLHHSWFAFPSLLSRLGDPSLTAAFSITLFPFLLSRLGMLPPRLRFPHFAPRLGDLLLHCCVLGRVTIQKYNSPRLASPLGGVYIRCPRPSSFFHSHHRALSSARTRQVSADCKVPLPIGLLCHSRAFQSSPTCNSYPFPVKTGKQVIVSIEPPSFSIRQLEDVGSGTGTGAFDTGCLLAQSYQTGCR